MAPRHALLAILLLVPLSGCSGRPLAAEAEPSTPSVAFVPPPLPHVEGTLVVSSLPVDPLAVAAGSMTNCMFVGDDSAGIVPIAGGSIRLEWSPESRALDSLTIVAANGEAASASATGSSPLWLNWTADSHGPLLLPFTVDVKPAGGAAVAIHQATTFTITVDADAPALEAIQGGC